VTIDGVWIGDWIYGTLTTRNYNLQFTITQTTLHSLFTSAAWQRLPKAEFPLLPGSRPHRMAPIPSNSQLQTDSRQTSVTQLDSLKARIRSRYIASRRPPQKTPLPAAASMLSHATAIAKTRLVCNCLATGVFTGPFPDNGCLCWLHNSDFRQTCHNILMLNVISSLIKTLLFSLHIGLSAINFSNSI
jgi:hypothetical protein